MARLKFFQPRDTLPEKIGTVIGAIIYAGLVMVLLYAIVSRYI